MATQPKVQGSAKDYLLANEAHDEDRLDAQHRMTVRSSGHLYHPDLGDLSSPLRILDSATGTGVWVKDLLEGAIDARNGQEPKLHPDTRIDLCDMTDKAVRKPLPATSEFWFYNVLEPFPEDRREKYDLIHQKLLCVALKKDQWLPSLKNLKDGLVPGGQLALTDLTGVFEPDRPSQIVAKAEWLFDKIWDAAGYDYRLDESLPRLLAEAGFVDIRPVLISWQYGPEGLKIGPDFPDSTMRHMRSVLDPKDGVIMSAAKPLFGRNGFPSYEDGAQIWEDFYEEVKTVSVKHRLIMVLARKPL